MEPFLEPPIEEPSIEQPSPDPKKLKLMKKKLDELNRKIRHSRKKHDEMIDKRNSLRKVIEALKRGTKPEPIPEPEWNFKEREQAFNGVYRSYRVNGRPKMEVDTFFNQTRKGLIDFIKRELNNLTSARIQMTTWIRFVKDDDRVELAFNSRMTSVHRGSDLDQIGDEMIAHMMTQIENPALLNSRFRFDEVLFLDISFHPLNLTRGNSHLPLPDLLARKKAIINPQNEDEEYFKWAVIGVENFNGLSKTPTNIEP